MKGPAYVWAPKPDEAPHLLQPRCDAHDEVWTGPKTYYLEAAQTNVSVHNEDEHKPVPHTELDLGLDPELANVRPREDTK